MTIARARSWTAVLLGLGLAAPCAAVEIAACTAYGAFTIELDEARAPKHAANFLAYIERGAYSGTVIHRVVADELVQTGGYDTGFRPIVPLEPVANESRNGLANLRGTVAAARPADPDSATSQFFVNLSANTHLDATDARLGYTVFGRVTSGIAGLETISRLPTRAAGPLEADVPDPLVEIYSMARVGPDAAAPGSAATQAEQLQRRVLDAAASRAPADVLAAVERYRAACAGLDPAVLLAEAEAAAALEQPRRARSALAQYFERAAPEAAGRERATALRSALTPGPRSTLERIAPDCAAPVAEDIPDGATASLDRMLAAQANVREFMDSSGTFLDCLSIVIDEGGLGDRERGIAVRRHNRHIEQMEDVANAFNAEVREFRARQPRARDRPAP